MKELHRLISPIDELIVSPSGSDRAEIKLSSSVTDNERAQDLQLVLPYLAQVAVSSIKHVWLSNEKCVGEDAIQVSISLIISQFIINTRLWAHMTDKSLY